jgi:hypothetical protein
LNLTLSAASAAFTISFAAGFDAYGCVDYIGQYTADQTLLLAANSTSYIYAERNVGTGALSLGYITSGGFSYGTAFPAAPATNLHFFNIRDYQMYYYSGSAWVLCQRVFLGEAVTGASSVTSATTYAYNGFFSSNWQAVVANTNYIFNHNLGIQLASANPTINIFTSAAANDGDAVLANPSLVFGGLVYGYQLTNSGVLSWRAIQITTRDYALINSANTWLTAGYYSVRLTRGW